MVITSGSLNSSTKATGTEQYELSYTDNFPTYVSLQNNKQATTYSQLTVRVTSENRTLVTNGKMSCLLLFKDDSDY
jgi:IS1 family transposase